VRSSDDVVVDYHANSWIDGATAPLVTSTYDLFSFLSLIRIRLYLHTKPSNNEPDNWPDAIC
jgi:hypothetical protein